MAKTIWKFPLHPAAPVQMPEGASILSVAIQGDGLFLWAMVDPNKPMVSRVINVYGTGHPLPERPGTFIGTAMVNGGSFVFHAFDAGPA